MAEQKLAKCALCQGTGLDAPGVEAQACPDCNGEGTVAAVEAPKAKAKTPPKKTIKVKVEEAPVADEQVNEEVIAPDASPDSEQEVEVNEQPAADNAEVEVAHEEPAAPEAPAEVEVGEAPVADEEAK